MPTGLPGVTFGGITQDNVTELKKINTASFPINYTDSFYKEVVEQNDVNLSKFAYWRGRIVGAICTRITTSSEEKEGSLHPQLYIMTLAVIAACRGRGIGSQLLQSVLDKCNDMAVQSITLHVHISNHDAIRFYTQRFGFVQGALVENYYRRIDPPHCYVVSKQLVSSSSPSPSSNESVTTITSATAATTKEASSVHTATSTNNTSEEGEEES